MMYITSLFSAAILMAYYFSALKALIIAVFIALFLFRIPELAGRRSIALLIVISLLAGILCFVSHDQKVSCFADHIGSEVKAVCTILQIQKKDAVGYDGKKTTGLQMTAYVDYLEEKTNAGREKIIVTCYGECFNDSELVPGNRIVISGTVTVPDTRRNPGCFDYALYLRSIGIAYIITADSIEIYQEVYNEIKFRETLCMYLGNIYRIKENFLSNIEKHANKKTAGMIRAVMFGEKTYLDEELLEQFRRNGTSHILAVSGLHIGIIYGFISFLWRWKKGRLFFCFTAIFFLVYMIMASFSPSVVRAVIMIWLHIFARLTNRRYDMASAAYFTALLMLINEPMSIFNVGFQMSFLAVLTLSLILPLIKRFYSGIFMASAAIQLGLAPYTIFTFNYFSIMSIFINVPIIFLTGILVPVGICNMLLMVVFEPFGAFAAKSLGGLCMIMEKLNSFTCLEGVTSFDVRSPDVWLVAIYYLTLLVFVSEDGRIMIMRKKKTVLRKMMFIVITAAIMIGLAAGNHFKNSEVVFVDVGQGECVHIRADKNISGIHNNYLVDGGGSISYEVGKKTLKPYLLKNGVKTIDGAFVTHLHTDHYKGIAELCREDMIERLYVFEGYRVKESRILDDTGLSKEQITYLHAGQRVRLGRDAYADILWPEASNDSEYERMTADEEDENELCLVMKITVKGISLIVTGDVDSACLDSLAERYGEVLDTDILKAAHHGSKYSDSETFAEAAKPEHAVFQVGKNNFGHPDQGVVENFRQKGIMIYRNDLDGAVAFDICRNGRIKVRTVKGE